MPPRAVSRPGFTGSGVQGLEQWLTQQLATNPNHQLPAGYKIDNGQVRRDTHGIMDTIGKYAPLAGLGIGAAANLPAIGSAVSSAVGGGSGSATATGASSMPGWLDKLKGFFGIAGNVGSVLGDMAGSRADAQMQAEGAQLTRDRLNLDRARYEDQSYMDRADLDLKRRTFEAEAPGRRLSTGMRASMLQNLQPRSNGPVQLSSGRSITPINFGTDPAMLMGPEAKGLGGEVFKQVMAQQGVGDKFNPIPDVNYPNPQGAPESSIMDKVLQVGSAVGNIGGAMVMPPVGRRRRPPQTPNPTPDPWDPEL